MTQEIQIDLLVPHPENCNHMETETREKVKRHIMRTGNYEPLTVRPHPDEKGKYQVINGHHRLKVLKQLGYKTVSCTVWDIDDDQTRLYLATLNRLAGKDVPERRAVLLEHLLGTFELEDLSELLPDPAKQLEEIARMAEMELENLKPFEDFSELKVEIPVMLSFMLSEPGATKVNEALDMIISDEVDISHSGALLRLALHYLQHNQSHQLEKDEERGVLPGDSISRC